MTTHVLILCTHNSARSVLSEGMLNHWAKKLGCDVRAHSAGSAPSGRINPFALEALQSAGVDTTGYHSKSWDAFSQDGAPPLAIVITVCDSAAAEQCPVFFGGTGGQPVGDTPVPAEARRGREDEGQAPASASAISPCFTRSVAIALSCSGSGSNAGWRLAPTEASSWKSDRFTSAGG